MSKPVTTFWRIAGMSYLQVRLTNGASYEARGGGPILAAQTAQTTQPTPTNANRRRSVRRRRMPGRLTASYGSSGPDGRHLSCAGISHQEVSGETTEEAPPETVRRTPGSPRHSRPSVVRIIGIDALVYDTANAPIWLFHSHALFLLLLLCIGVPTVCPLNYPTLHLPYYHSTSTRPPGRSGAPSRNPPGAGPWRRTSSPSRLRSGKVATRASRRKSRPCKTVKPFSFQRLPTASLSYSRLPHTLAKTRSM